jgi:methylglutaconyl-CoA hydratase
MPALRVDYDGIFLRLTLARPDKRNALSPELIAELSKAFSDVGPARAVVLAADGPGFSAGADIDWMRSAAGLSREENIADALRLRRMLESIDRCEAPVVCRVHGHAVGGALGLVAAADVALASEDAVFGFPEVRLGIVPAVISPFVLARIGEGPARRYFLTGERFGAFEALRIGLVHEVATDVDAAVERVLDALLAAGPEAVRAAKRLVLDAPLGDSTAERIADSRAAAEGQEGLQAFLERRPPDWIPSPD